MTATQVHDEQASAISNARLVDITVVDGDDPHAPCGETLHRWTTDPPVDYSYSALYIVNGKDLGRLLHDANYPRETAGFDDAERQLGGPVWQDLRSGAFSLIGS